MGSSPIPGSGQVQVLASFKFWPKGSRSVRVAWFQVDSVGVEKALCSANNHHLWWFQIPPSDIKPGLWEAMVGTWGQRAGGRSWHSAAKLFAWSQRCSQYLLSTVVFSNCSSVRSRLPLSVLKRLPDALSLHYSPAKQ